MVGRPSAALAVRGCPIHNAAVELSDPAHPAHPAHPVILAHKRAFLGRLVDTARQARARDPETLGRQLFVLFEGAAALGTSIDDVESYDHARPVAVGLIEQAIPAADRSANSQPPTPDTPARGTAPPYSVVSHRVGVHMPPTGRLLLASSAGRMLAWLGGGPGCDAVFGPARRGV